MPKRRSQTAHLDTSFQSTLIHHHENIRKSCSSSDDEDTIPISIQSFLWRQSR